MANQGKNMEVKTTANDPEFLTSKGKVVAAGKPAEELFRMYDTGKMRLPSSFRRLAVYAHLERSGLIKPAVKLPCYQSILEESICYSEDEKNDDYSLAVIRAQRCSTWMQEQKILCDTKRQAATLLLKAECLKGYSEMAIQTLNKQNPGEAAKGGRVIAAANTIPPAALRKALAESIAYITAFNLVIEYLAVYLKIPEVMLYQVDLSELPGLLGRLAGIENELKANGLEWDYLEVKKSLPEDLGKKMKIPTKAETKKKIKDLIAFDGSLVFSATQPLLKPLCDDMTGDIA
jgi:hypothetical protein